MRRRAAIACLVAVAALTGCGLGAGAERSGAGVDLRVTRDFGHRLLLQRHDLRLREDETAMRLLQANADVQTRFGGGFVQSIDGLEGRGSTGTSDWFYYVNGIEVGEGAADFELSPGDVMQWDHRDWAASMDVRAIVGAFPQPFLDGFEGKRFPVRVECQDVSSDPCEQVKRRLGDEGVPVSGSSLGASGDQHVARVIVADWASARILTSAKLIELGPKHSGVFARFAADGRSLLLLDERGRTVRIERAGAGLVAALRPTDDEVVWLVTGVDAAGVQAAADALDAGHLRDAFAVSSGPDGVEGLPLEDRP